jgi:hypothetical protein
MQNSTAGLFQSSTLFVRNEPFSVNTYSHLLAMQLRLFFALFSVLTPWVVALPLESRSGIDLSQRDDFISASSSSSLIERGLDTIDNKIMEIVAREFLAQHSPGELKGRDLEDIDSRAVSAIMSGVQAVGEGIAQVVKIIKAKVEKDKKVSSPDSLGFTDSR